MNQSKIKGLVFFILLLMLYSCASLKKMQKELPSQIEQSSVFQKSFTGFALLNPKTGKFIYEYQSDKYFTPASNTKIFTLFTAMQLLEENPPILEYEEIGDSLIFSGTGNPYFLHPVLASNRKGFDFLKNSDKQLFFSSSNFNEARFGPGWAWDDYPYYFQPEKSPMPIYGNVVNFKKDSAAYSLKVEPKLFEKNLQKAIEPKVSDKNVPRINRNEFDNTFIYNQAATNINHDYSKEIPFLYSDSLFVQLLSDTLGKKVVLWKSDFQFSENKKRIQGNSMKPLYQILMKDSDNFVAEQLLLMCGHQKFGELNIRRVIDFAKSNLFQKLPDELVWRDGSGLSRYNLFTPRSIAQLLAIIYQELPEEELFDIFPAGGVSGTIENWYGSDKKPYIFAKTGTLTGKHCLSGYLKTKSGETLIFSFMHNNYTTGSAPLKKEMAKVLKDLYEQF